jgi:hypothetical protein
MGQAQTQLDYRRRRFSVLVFIALLSLGWAITSSLQSGHNTEPAADQAVLSAGIDDGTFRRAVEVLGEIAVRDQVSREGYTRAEFGSGWRQVGGCDTRNLILQRDLADAELADDGCTVLSGVLQQDPYTALAIPFNRGPDTSSAVQIDHVVALSDAWQKGAQQIEYERRVIFANDPLNLLAVDGPANMKKSDKDAADWLPEPTYQCRYVARQIAVKHRYELWVTTREQRAMKRVLGTCLDQVLPVVGNDVTP